MKHSAEMRALAIVHEQDAGPGVFTDAVHAAGAQLDCWQITAGAPAPSDPFGYDAVISFGGAMHPDQDELHPWLADEKALLAGLLERGTPLLGVCLGAELVACAAGAPVGRAARPEIGWYAVAKTPQASTDPLLGPLQPRFDALEWHSYEFGLPAGATLLARSDNCLQAIRLGEAAWAIQFHAEVTLSDFESWLRDYSGDEDALGLDVERFRMRTRAAIGDWNAIGQGLCRRFLDAAAER